MKLRGISPPLVLLASLCACAAPDDQSTEAEDAEKMAQFYRGNAASCVSESATDYVMTMSVDHVDGLGVQAPANVRVALVTKTCDGGQPTKYVGLATISGGSITFIDGKVVGSYWGATDANDPGSWVFETPGQDIAGLYIPYNQTAADATSTYELWLQGQRLTIEHIQ